MRRSSKAGSQFATVLRDFATTTMSVVAATKASKMKMNGKLGKTNHLPLFVRHGELTSRNTRPDVSKDCNEVLDFYVFLVKLSRSSQMYAEALEPRSPTTR